VHAQVILADFAQVADGKLTVVGAGWDRTGPTPTPSGIGILIKVPWEETNQRHEVAVQLLDSDGAAVADPKGQPIGMANQFEVGRPAGLAAGAQQNVCMALNVGPLPLQGGQRYEWVLSIDGETHEDWRVAFHVRTAPERRA
jgi:hypothetical protein